MATPLDTATVCHDDDKASDPHHRRVTLHLAHDTTPGGRDRLRWYTVSDDGTLVGTDAAVPAAEGIEGARAALRTVYGAAYWDLRADWL